VAVEFTPEELGFPIEVGEITVTSCPSFRRKWANPSEEPMASGSGF